jgi:GAF domain-containing protein
LPKLCCLCRCLVERGGCFVPQLIDSIGRGVCGTAAEKRSTLRIADVTKFPGHIACDAESRSEVVIPLLTDDSHLIGVLDVDSPELNRFDADDETGLSAIAEIVARAI